MVAAANMVEIAALVGDTARATMLAALMGGQALTSSELAALAHISRPTASGHLGKMVAARLLSVSQARRHRYYRIASPLVARMLESIKAVAAIETPARYRPRSAQDDALHFARTCYDHLAGQLGVAIADALVARRYLVLTEDGGEVTPAGMKFLAGFGANLTARTGVRRAFCRACLDWSERRYHLAGLVGAEIWRRCVELGWVVRQHDARAVGVTASGRRGFRDALGVRLDFECQPCATSPRVSSAVRPLAAARLRGRARPSSNVRP
jgi:DNA-binding transcriptional ArsR family regulator